MNMTLTSAQCTLVLDKDTVLAALGRMTVTLMEGTILCETSYTQTRQFKILKLMGRALVPNETKSGLQFWGSDA
jgi:hypothetical protein